MDPEAGLYLGGSHDVDSLTVTTRPSLLFLNQDEVTLKRISSFLLSSFGHDFKEINIACPAPAIEKVVGTNSVQGAIKR